MENVDVGFQDGFDTWRDYNELELDKVFGIYMGYLVSHMRRSESI